MAKIDPHIFYEAGIVEAYRRVLASAQMMTRPMLIQWLEQEVKERLGSVAAKPPTVELWATLKAAP